MYYLITKMPIWGHMQLNSELRLSTMSTWCRHERYTNSKTIIKPILYVLLHSCCCRSVWENTRA